MPPASGVEPYAAIRRDVRAGMSARAVERTGPAGLAGAEAEAVCGARTAEMITAPRWR
jgi:hypothetical protein